MEMPSIVCDHKYHAVTELDSIGTDAPVFSSKSSNNKIYHDLMIAIL